MSKATFASNAPADALSWMLEHGLILRKTENDPETFIPVHGYVLSYEMQEEIGNNLVKLFKKAMKMGCLKGVTIGDGFVTATMAALLANTESTLGKEELTTCTNIILKLLPFDRLEAAGLTSKTLHHLSRDRALLRKLREACRTSV
jgi:hypothetical protein